MYTRIGSKNSEGNAPTRKKYFAESSFASEILGSVQKKARIAELFF